MIKELCDIILLYQCVNLIIKYFNLFPIFYTINNTFWNTLLAKFCKILNCLEWMSSRTATYCQTTLKNDSVFHSYQQNVFQLSSLKTFCSLLKSISLLVYISHKICLFIQVYSLLLCWLYFLIFYILDALAFEVLIPERLPLPGLLNSQR